jgi:methylglutaconyl-CoA hydratase
MASNSRIRITLHLARRLGCRQVRYSSTEASQSPLIVRNVPAPYFGSIRILSLNRPHARNALSRELLDRLKQEAHDIQVGLNKGKAGNGYEGTPRALILASETDNCFCAGADLKERLKFTQEEYALST